MSQARSGGGDPAQNPENLQQNPDTYVGTPEVDMFSWVGPQSFDDTCQIRVEEYILEMYTGMSIPEDVLVQEAADNGWYTPGGGTPPEYSGNLLELHGVPVNNYEDATTYDLANELAQGHKVIVGVDAFELWDKADKGEKPANMTDNHAVVVSGIDTSDPNDIRVIVSDPGTGEAAASYPMNQFVAAWKDSSFSITATEEPAPSSQPEMANFDYEAGHISEVMGLPYEDFATLDPQSEEWNSLVEQETVDDGTFVSPADSATYPTGEVSDGSEYPTEVPSEELPYDQG